MLAFNAICAVFTAETLGGSEKSNYLTTVILIDILNCVVISL